MYLDQQKMMFRRFRQELLRESGHGVGVNNPRERTSQAEVYFWRQPWDFEDSCGPSTVTAIVRVCAQYCFSFLVSFDLALFAMEPVFVWQLGFSSLNHGQFTKRLLGVVWCDLGPPRQPVKDHSQLCDDRLPPCRSEPTLQKATLSIQRVFRRAFSEYWSIRILVS